MMIAANTEISARFVKLHELVDTLTMNISYLRADLLDAKEPSKVMPKFSKINELIATLQVELDEVKEEYLEPEKPEQRNRRWKVAPTC